eukprot:1958357-Amphidinium_carterae.1
MADAKVLHDRLEAVQRAGACSRGTSTSADAAKILLTMALSAGAMASRLPRTCNTYGVWNIETALAACQPLGEKHLANLVHFPSSASEGEKGQHRDASVHAEENHQQVSQNSQKQPKKKADVAT